jgi:hypothetical protein
MARLGGTDDFGDDANDPTGVVVAHAEDRQPQALDLRIARRYVPSVSFAARLSMCMKRLMPIVSTKNFSAMAMSLTTQATWQNAGASSGFVTFGLLLMTLITPFEIRG